MNTKLRELIKKRMDDLNIQQIDIAKRLSVAPSHVSRIISGGRGTTLDNLISLADVLKIDRTYFLRVAAGLNTETDGDEWVEVTNNKIKLISTNRRGIVDSFIDSMLKGEEAEPKPKAKVKPVKP